MVKVKKKKNRKLRRQIRKTIGALLMVSAITVAAIPVQDIRADEPEELELFEEAEPTALSDEGLARAATDKVRVLNQTASGSYETIAGASSDQQNLWRSGVPYVPAKSQIYTDYTGVYQFAFIKPYGEDREVAVILKADIGNLPQGKLVIEEKVDAYRRYSPNTSDVSSLCAVSKSDEILYFDNTVPKRDANGNQLYTVPDLDRELAADGQQTIGEIIADGSKLIVSDGTATYYHTREKKNPDGSPVLDDQNNPVMETVPYTAIVATEIRKQPCYRDDYDKWKDATLYYEDPTAEGGYSVSDPADALHGRIYDAQVAYIGRQYLKTENGTTTIEEVTDANPTNGVFAGNGNIRELEVPQTLLGIGDYAFYRCTALESINLGNGLNTIGNGAFANCSNMTSCNLDRYTKINVIGAQAFLNCEKLTDFVVPLQVDAIGDLCFRGCTSLRTIDMSGGLSIENYSDREANQLTTIGYRAFEGCTVLDELTFPNKCKEEIPITYMLNCTNLRKITTLDSEGKFDIVEDPDSTATDHTKCSIAQFLSNKPDFYFEGYENSAVRETAREHSAAFSYLDMYGNIAGKFEKVVKCTETPKQHESIFVVNKDNQLIDMTIDEDCGEINIPASIGGYSILEVAPRGFEYNCNLKRIIIPSSINRIGEYAFRGCHNLKDVIFQSPINSQMVIETGAFDTQDSARGGSLTCDNCSDDLDVTPVLTFTGDIYLEDAGINSAPFEYAMNPANNINIGPQTQDTYITFYSGWPTNLTVKYNKEKDKNELVDYPRYEDLENYQRGTYPDMTEEQAETAQEVVKKFDPDNPNTAGFTADEQAVIDSVYQIVLPVGIEAIKEGIFSGVNSENEPVDGGDVNEYVSSIVMQSVQEIEPYAFAGCPNLESFYANGLNDIGDYAFIHCAKLINVDMGKDVVSMGMRPFAKCSVLQNVGFTDNPNFMCDNAIIFGTKDGAKESIIECLEARGQIDRRVGPDELAGVSSIAEEAFKDCDGVGTINLSMTTVSEIPRECFSQTDNIGEVYMPETLTSIGKGAFWNSKVFYVDLPDGITFIEPDAFAYVLEDDGEIVLDDKGDPTIQTRRDTIQFHCAENNRAANTYADRYDYIKADPYVPEIRYRVTFWDNYEDQVNPTLLKEEMVLSGEDATPPLEKDMPVHEGVSFTGWNRPYTNITGPTEIFALYGDAIYTVQFADYDGKPIGEPQYVEAGKSARAPEPPVHEGATFTGWSPDYRDIDSDRTCIAQYNWSADVNSHKATFYSYDGTTVIAEYTIPHNGKVYAPAAPSREGYTFVGWVPAVPADGFTVTADQTFNASYERGGSGDGSGSNSGNNGGSSNATPTPRRSSSSSSASPTPTATPEAETRKYTVSVSGGSGSGSYAAGQVVSINAYFMGEGQVFDKWTSSTAGVGFANPNASSTTFTMPAANVAITATYKTGGTGTAATNASGSGSGGSTGTVSQSNGTTVDVTKPGFSNTNLAGATVSGATDNFVVKVTEDQIATDAATAALQARYGSLDRIKYLPMDISLYDSTGRTKIADTSGISVNLTLPLPDDLVQYAGNNRVAAISNGQLEDLNTRFTTVGGVPCVNFTATHFSPYVIYVDTANLTEATIDATPQTGDPIHPKWFLSLGMACLALILFFKKDRAVVVKKRVA